MTNQERDKMEKKIPKKIIDKWCRQAKLIQIQPHDGLSFVINTIIPDVKELLNETK